jgi:hypothetical protein
LCGERKGSEMVCLELKLEAIFCDLPLLRRHHRGVIDQEIERLPLRRC